MPFAKTGGLADVCGSLPRELHNLGHEVVLFLPAYRSIWQAGQTIDLTATKFSIAIGKKQVEGCLLKSQLPGSAVPVYFVHQPGYFDRPNLYGHDGEDFNDNCERFVFFCRALMESIHLLDWRPDVIHCNDWQTGLIPVLQRTEYSHRAGYESIRTLMTIHNLAYQGCFWHWDMLLTGVDWQYFNWQQMEFYGQLNLLKTGIVFADAISTVSPRYAQEIQTHEFGHGLEGALRSRGGDLIGILNGIDTNEWNPATDESLPFKYGVDNWQAGKAACKFVLQQELGLVQSASTPLIGCIGRLASQKGWALILSALQRWLSTSDVQWAVLGTGDWEYQQALLELQKRFPQKLGLRLEFSEPLAHRIEAAADLFLMPSRYEPCGLNQMYSLRYGAVPVVFNTGGLADTVVDANNNNLRLGTANGFVFYDHSVESMIHALKRAVEMQQDQPGAWERIVTTGMRQDWSWARSAKQYELLYRRIVSDANHPGC